MLKRSAKPRLKDDGFSLVESLAALAVFSLVTTASLALVQNNIYSAARLEARLYASYVAENQMVETRLTRILVTSDTKGEVVMGGRTFEWERVITDSEDSATLKNVVIRVRLSDDTQTLAELAGFWHE